MSTVRRYTAEDFRESARMLDRAGYAEFAKEMRQAAETEARVMGLSETVQAILDNSFARITDFGPTGHFDIEARHLDVAREALSKFRGEDA